MQEFTTVSSSTYEPAALAARLTEKSAEGWQVLSIVPTGGDITAFLVREAAAAASDASAAVTATAADPAPAAAVAAAAAAATEPAGWAVAPVSTSTQDTGYTASATAAVSTPATVAPAASTPAAATPSVPAGWYADPSGRYELRYWDGTEWTEHVSRAGQQYTDPPVR